jgi:hypothetical protein
MSGRERERLVVIAQVCGKGVSRGAAAERLGICVRQVKRLVRAYRAEGDAGLVSRQRGRTSNLRLAPGVGERASELLGGKCRDFGPTLACEKLAQLEGISSRARRSGGSRFGLAYGSRIGDATSGCFNCASGGRDLAN